MIRECFPYLRVHDGHAALAFYEAVFGATRKLVLIDPSNDRVAHAELRLGDGILMVSDAYPEMGILAPTGNTGMAVHLHVDDCDALLARAVAHGATQTMAPADQFQGERSAKFRDPFGHEWYVGHSLEAVDDAEILRRWLEMTS